MRTGVLNLLSAFYTKDYLLYIFGLFLQKFSKHFFTQKILGLYLVASHIPLKYPIDSNTPG